METKHKVVVAAAAVLAAGGFAVYQLSRMLFAVLNSSYDEGQKALLAVAARINSDSPDDEVPEELMLIDDVNGVYAYGPLQELYFRRSVGGETDWEWSYDTDEWFSTGDLAPDHTLLLDPPSIIFILRLHLLGVARRKVAAAAGTGSGGGSTAACQRAARIPPAVELPDWAKEQQQHIAAGRWQRSSLDQRQLIDAPEILCCPITGQVMLQPVTLPSGKTFEYEAVRRWITRHGSDPTTLARLSIHEVYPNLIVREMVERWLATGDALSEASDCPSTSHSQHSSQQPQLQQHHQQQQQQQQQPQQLPGLGMQQQGLLQNLQQDEDSEDPLSSFGASSSSSTSSSTPTSVDGRPGQQKEQDERASRSSNGGARYDTAQQAAQSGSSSSGGSRTSNSSSWPNTQPHKQ